MSPSYAFAASLIGLGVLSYLMTGRKSYTALIPSIFGLTAALLLAFTTSASNGVPSHSILAVASVGLLGTVRGLAAWLRNLLDHQPRNSAVASKGLMAVICAMYVTWSVFA